MARKPKRVWVKADGYWYLIAICNRMIWAKISGYIEGVSDTFVQHVTVHTIGNGGNHVIAQCGGFGLEEAQGFAEKIAMEPFPEKLVRKRIERAGRDVA